MPMGEYELRKLLNQVRSIVTKISHDLSSLEQLEVQIASKLNEMEIQNKKKTKG